MDLTFSGGGFMGNYYIGVVECWNKYIPKDRINRVAGASSGSLIAAYYLLDLPMELCLRELITLTEDVRSRTLGVFDRSNQIVDVLPRVLDEIFPEDAHKKVSVWSGNHVSTYKGVKHVDGGMTDNLPVFDENTIRICCFAGQTDISPSDRSQKELLSSNILNTPLYFTMKNFRRGAMALWPPPPTATLDLIKRGFHDTKQFILDNDLIQCDRCYQQSEANSACKFLCPNPTISPAVSPAPSRRLSVRSGSTADLSACNNDVPLGNCFSLHKDDLSVQTATAKRIHSPDSMLESSCSPSGSADSNAVPSIVILSEDDSMSALDQENSSPAAAAAKKALVPRDRHQTKKRSRTNSIPAQAATLSARRKSSLALGPRNELLAVQDKFKSAPNQLPSCPPSPNLNRHCNECLRLRQAARNDHLEDNIRQVAESFIAEMPAKGSGIRRKLSGPLRWIRTQFRPKHCYDFNQQQVPLE